MKHANLNLLNTLVLVFLLAASLGVAFADNTGQGRPVSIRFPAFSLNPGEKISGMTVKTSKGRLITGCLPRRWSCEHRGNVLHCYSLHPSYAIALTGLLPEIIVRDISDSGGQLTIEASIEYIDADGKEYSKEFKESDLIVK